MVLRCLNDYKNLGLNCTEALELPWKYPPSFIKDWVKLMVASRRSKCLLWGSGAGSFHRADNTYTQSDFSHTAKQRWQARSVPMCISLQQSLDTQCGTASTSTVCTVCQKRG